MPYGTFAVNVLGAFLIGLSWRFSLRSPVVSQELRMGLTMASSGIHHVLHLQLRDAAPARKRQFLQAAVNVFSSVAVCLVFTFVGSAPLAACKGVGR